jgi:hypothetical protein
MIAKPQYMLFVAPATIHAVIDRMPIEWWAILAVVFEIFTLLAVGYQIWLAMSALRVARRELVQANAQLELTRQTSDQTTEALRLTRQQLDIMQTGELNRLRATAPRIVAESTFVEYTQSDQLTLVNKGGVAQFVMLSCRDKTGESHPAAGNFFQTIAPGERSITKIECPSGANYIRNLRIRANDIYGNKYITEYRTFNKTLLFPIFREPWLLKEFAPRPLRCSEEVSWPVEHFERLIGVPDEPVEVDFNPDEPV